MVRPGAGLAELEQSRAGTAALALEHSERRTTLQRPSVRSPIGGPLCRVREEALSADAERRPPVPSLGGGPL